MTDFDQTIFAEMRKATDQWACQKLHEQYWYAEAKRDADAVALVFSADGQYGAAKGQAAIRAKAQEYFGQMASIVENYHIIPIVADIIVDGDNAHGEIRGVGFIHVRKPDGTMKVLGLGIAYRDTFLRTANGWRISRMHAIVEGKSRPHDTTWQFEVPVVESLANIE